MVDASPDSRGPHHRSQRLTTCTHTSSPRPSNRQEYSSNPPTSIPPPCRPSVSNHSPVLCPRTSRTSSLQMRERPSPSSDLDPSCDTSLPVKRAAMHLPSFKLGREMTRLFPRSEFGDQSGQFGSRAQKILTLVVLFPILSFHAKTHDTFLVTQGSIKLWANDQCRILYPGDFGSIPPVSTGALLALTLKINPLKLVLDTPNRTSYTPFKSSNQTPNSSASSLQAVGPSFSISSENHTWTTQRTLPLIIDLSPFPCLSRALRLDMM